MHACLVATYLISKIFKVFQTKKYEHGRICVLQYCLKSFFFIVQIWIHVTEDRRRAKVQEFRTWSLNPFLESSTCISRTQAFWGLEQVTVLTVFHCLSAMRFTTWSSMFAAVLDYGRLAIEVFLLLLLFIFYIFSSHMPGTYIYSLWSIAGAFPTSLRLALYTPTLP